METKQIWVLVAGALLIAIVVSVISANITGNVIKVKTDNKGPQVYTKAEVDAKVNALNNKVTGVATYQGVLNMLSNQCEHVSGREVAKTQPERGNQIVDSCEKICKEYRSGNKRNCLVGLVSGTDSNTNVTGFSLASCSMKGVPHGLASTIQLSCICCSAPSAQSAQIEAYGQP
jgi:hypothetical protein